MGNRNGEMALDDSDLKTRESDRFEAQWYDTLNPLYEDEDEDIDEDEMSGHLLGSWKSEDQGRVKVSSVVDSGTSAPVSEDEAISGKSARTEVYVCLETNFPILRDNCFRQPRIQGSRLKSYFKLPP